MGNGLLAHRRRGVLARGAGQAVDDVVKGVNDTVEELTESVNGLLGRNRD